MGSRRFCQRRDSGHTAVATSLCHSAAPQRARGRRCSTTNLVSETARIASSQSFHRPHYLRVEIYAAMSAASVRVNCIFGILGCGSSRKKASLFASKSRRFATTAKGGASVDEFFCPGATRWQSAHQRFTTISPWFGSAANAELAKQATNARTMARENHAHLRNAPARSNKLLAICIRETALQDSP